MNISGGAKIEYGLPMMEKSITNGQLPGKLGKIKNFKFQRPHQLNNFLLKNLTAVYPVVYPCSIQPNLGK